MPVTLCPSVEELTAFDLGTVSGSRYEELAQHLEDCRECAARFERMEERADHVLADLRADFPAEVVTDDSELRRLASAVAAMRDTVAADQFQTIAEGGHRPKFPVEESFPRLLALPQADDELGRLGGYRVLEVLGAGGMGVVFRAEDVALKRQVALKAMQPRAAAIDDHSSERFLREAQAAAAVQSDHIVTIHQVGEDRGVPFLAMQLLQGESLAARLRRDGKLDAPEALRIARETAQGLAAAHAKGLTHRDIKPDNIWLEAPTGRVKILDFGLARAADAASRLTVSGAIVGTPSYLSPEQTQDAAVDARSDLFSLGVVLYEMLTGKRPFERSSLVAIIKAISSDTPATPRELDPTTPLEQSALVMRLLEKDAEKRFQSAAELIAAIDELSPVAPRKAAPFAAREDVLSRSEGRQKRRWWIAAAALGVVGLLLAAAMIYVKTDRGTIVVEAGQGFEVTSGDQMVTIRDTETGRTYEVRVGEEATLPSGPYEIVVKDNEGLEFKAAQFEVKRGHRELLVTLQPPPLPDQPDDSDEPATTIADQGHLPPISPVALVQRPAKLPAHEGVEPTSWTIVPTGVQRSSAAALRADGALLATFGDDGVIRVWDVQRKKLHRALLGHDAGPCSHGGLSVGNIRTNSRRFGPIAWRPGDKKTWLATASRDGSVRVWDVETGTSVWHEAGEVDGINMLAWSPDGAMLAVGYGDGRVKCWQAEGWTELEPLSLADGPPFSLGWSPDSERLSVHSAANINVAHGTVQVWNPIIGETRQFESVTTNGTFTGANPRLAVSVMRWSPDGKWLAYMLPDCLRILDTTTWEETHRLNSPAADAGRPIEFAWSPDSESLIVSWDGAPVLHNLASGDATQIPIEPGKAIKKTFVVEWPTASHALLWTMDDTHDYLLLLDPQDMVTKQVNSNGSYVHEASDDGRLVLTQWEGYPAVYRIEDQQLADGFRPPATPGVAHGATWSPDGRWVSYGTGTGTAIWQLQDGALPDLPWTLGGLISIVNWSPDGKRFFAYEGGPSNFFICSTHDRRRIAEFELPFLPHCTTWSPDGTQIALGRAGKREILIVDSASGKPLHEWIPPDSTVAEVSTLCWSPSGKSIAVYANGPQVLDATNGELRFRFDYAPSVVGFQRMAWGPEDKRVLIIGEQELAVYAGDSGKHQSSFALQGGNLSAVHFIDADTVLCGTRDGLVYRLGLATGTQEIVIKGLGEVIEISPDGRHVAFVLRGTRRIRRLDGTAVASFVSTYLGDPVVIAASGHLWTPDNPSCPFWATKGSLPTTLAYVVQTPAGQQTLTPLQFAERYGWRNDPSQVRLK